MPSAPEFEAPQGTPFHSVQLRAITESLAGNGVVNNGDFEVTATATDLEIQVAAGTFFYIATNYSLGAPATHTLSAGDGTNDRWDTVYFDTATTTTGVREGTPAQNPVAPDIQSDEVLLAVIYVPSGATDVPDSDILNWRAKFSNEAEEVHYNDTPGVYPGNSVSDALDELQEAAQISAYPLSIATDTEATAYPLASADIATDAVGTAEIATDAVGTSELDLSITPTWTGVHTFTQLIAAQGGIDIGDDGVVKGDLRFFTGGSDYAMEFFDDLGSKRIRIGFDVSEDLVFFRDNANATNIFEFSVGGDVDVAYPLRGLGGIQHISQTGAPTETREGFAWYDSDEDTPKFSDGANYQRPLARQDVEQFDKDETGTVANGNIGIISFTNVPNGSTIEILQAGLLLEDLQPAPTDLDLTIFTGDNAGSVTNRQIVIDGDGTVKDDQTGSPLASWTNNTGSALTTALGVDNGQFNAGTGVSQDVAVSYIGRVV